MQLLPPQDGRARSKTAPRGAPPEGLVRRRPVPDLALLVRVHHLHFNSLDRPACEFCFAILVPATGKMDIDLDTFSRCANSSRRFHSESACCGRSKPSFSVSRARAFLLPPAVRFGRTPHPPPIPRRQLPAASPLTLTAYSLAYRLGRRFPTCGGQRHGCKLGDAKLVRCR